jgi:hypothetical protein
MLCMSTDSQNSRPTYVVYGTRSQHTAHAHSTRHTHTAHGTRHTTHGTRHTHTLPNANTSMEQCNHY